MPELPDIETYLRCLRPRVTGATLMAVRVCGPFLVRSVDPPVSAVQGRAVGGLRRLGKRIVFDFGEELFAVLHLMIAGRLRWRSEGEKRGRVAGKVVLAEWQFDRGTMWITEASTQKRASLHIVRGEAALVEHDRGGIEPLDADVDAFRRTLLRENHTLKRTLTDPRLFSGIGNAYSDEILHAAGLSPVKWTTRLDDDEIARLHAATQAVLRRWIDELATEFADRFPGPGDITAFRPGFAVHGRFGQPCPVCSTAVQRIRYADNETNYCPRCQTDGKLLADRSLSRLLKGDLPRSVEELEAGDGSRHTKPQ